MEVESTPGRQADKAKVLLRSGLCGSRGQGDELSPGGHNEIANIASSVLHNSLKYVKFTGKGFG